MNPHAIKNADRGSSANVRRTEGDAVESVVPDQLGIYILHAGGYGGYDLLKVELGVIEVAAGEEAFLVLLVHEVSRFVGNHDFRTGTGDAGHLLQGTFLVVEKIDAAYMKDDIEAVVCKRKILCTGVHK